MASLSEKELEELERRLRQRREDLRWAVHSALVESEREDYVQLAGAVHDAAEESVADLLESMNHFLLNREVEQLRDIEAALERIRDGSYGVCIDCGDAIAPQRLRAYPTAKRCFTCQTRYETALRGGRDATPSL